MPDNRSPLAACAGGPAQGAPGATCTMRVEPRRPPSGRQPRAPRQPSRSRRSRLTRARGGASSSGCSTRPRTTSTRSASSTGAERDQVVADFEEQSRLLEAAYDRLVSRRRPVQRASLDAEPAGEVRLQASWSAGEIVVWAAGPDADPADNDELADRLEAIGGPALGWSIHPDVPLRRRRPGRGAVHPGRPRRSAGWSPSAAAGDRDGRRRQRRLARPGGGGGGAPRGPGLGGPDAAGHQARRRAAALDLAVRWMPALVDDSRARARSPRPCPARSPSSAGGDARAVTLDVLGAVVDAIVGDGRRPARAAGPAARPPAPPPRSPRRSSPGSTARPSRRRWRPAPRCPSGSTAGPAGVTGAVRSRLVVQLDPPDSGNAWFLSVLGPGADGTLLPIEVALGDSKATKPLADELVRLERILPALLRPGGLRRGQVYLSQAEAWELMTVTGRGARGGRLRGAGARAVAAQADARPAPVHRARRATPSSAPTSSATCAGRRCSTTSSSPRPTSPGWPPRPARSCGPAASGSSSTGPTSRRRPPRSPSGPQATKLTGAEILRHAVGLEGTAARRRPHRRGHRLGHRPAREGAGGHDRGRSRSPRASTASCAATRPRRSAGSASSTPSSSAAASPSTWAWARRRPCSPTSPAPPARARRS